MGEISNVQLAQINTIANWDSTLIRYFLVDYDGGSDSNVGYVDAAAGTTLTPTGLPFKTLEKLVSVLPGIGRGRSAVVLIKPRAAGAMYLKADGLTNDGLDLTALSGYKRLVVRGSMDLTNSTSDRINCGGITAVAEPTNGYWTCDAGSTATTVTLTTAISAEPVALGYRARFLGNVTPALADVCEMVHAHTTGAVTFSGDLPTTPAAGDRFYIEKPGVQLSEFKLDRATQPANWTRVNYADYTPASGSPFHSVAGIRVTTGGQFNTTCAYAMSFVAVEAGQWMNGGSTLNHVATFAYPDETGTVRKTGTGTRVTESNADSDTTLNGTNIVDLTNCLFFHSSASRLLAGNVSGLMGVVYIGRSSIFWNMRVYIAANAVAQDMLIGTRPSESTAGPRQKMRLTGSGGRLTVLGSSFDDIGYGTGGGYNQGVQEVDFTGSGAGLWINMSGGSIKVDGCVGTLLSGEPGMRIYSRNSQLVIGSRSANTLTGSVGAVLLGYTGTSLVTFADYTDIGRCGFVDTNNNEIRAYLQATNIAGVVAKLTRPMTNGSGVTLNGGTVVRLSSTDTFTVAQADSAANCTDVFGVLLTQTTNGSVGYVALFGSTAAVYFDVAAPSVGKVYLSATTAGIATNTVPPVSGTNQKLRLGYCTRSLGSNYGVVDLRPEMIPVTSDGNP